MTEQNQPVAAVPVVGEASVDPTRYRLTVRQETEAESPRELGDGDHAIGTIVLSKHRRYLLPREGELVSEIDERLTDRAYGATVAERFAALAAWLTGEHGASVVLPVWFYDHSGLSLAAVAEGNPFPDPAFDSGLAGVVYDTPQARERTGVPAELIGQALIDEVAQYNAWNNGEVWRWSLEERDEQGRWWVVDSATCYGEYQAARREGEQQWRERFGSLYTEVAPFGPTDNGDSGGDAQLTTAWGRRFVRPLTDGIRFGVVDVEFYVVNANPDPDGPREIKIEHTIAYTVCEDPTDPGGTEVQCYTRYPEVPRAEDDPLPTDEDCRRLCAQFDPSVLDWDGEPVS